MPRNPHKARCSVPGCGAWAMRDQTRCRAHRDAELGSRGAGAPHHNLNAVKHGRHSHPIPPPDLDRFVEVLVTQPQDLPYQLGLVAHSIQARTGDPFLTLAVLRGLLPHLTARVAAGLFSEELRTTLQPLPPPVRAGVQAVIELRASGLSPEARLLKLRKRKKTRENN